MPLASLMGSVLVDVHAWPHSPAKTDTLVALHALKRLEQLQDLALKTKMSARPLVCDLSQRLNEVEPAVEGGDGDGSSGDEYSDAFDDGRPPYDAAGRHKSAASQLREATTPRAALQHRDPLPWIGTLGMLPGIL